MDIYHFMEPVRSNGKLTLKQSQMVSAKIESNEEVNFYALQLLLKVVRETEKNSKNRVVKPKSWLCNWT